MNQAQSFANKLDLIQELGQAAEWDQCRFIGQSSDDCPQRTLISSMEGVVGISQSQPRTTRHRARMATRAYRLRGEC